MFTLSIETDAGTYQHGFHLGTDERTASEMAVEICLYRKPAMGTRIVTVGLKKDGKLIDTFDGKDWSSMLLERAITEGSNGREG